MCVKATVLTRPVRPSAHCRGAWPTDGGFIGRFEHTQSKLAHSLVMHV